MIPVSVTILTCNSARHLAKVLAALRQFEEVVVLDSGSKDETLTIAKSFPNVRIFETIFSGFGPMHNLATSHARLDWILSMDSDEVVSPELAEEIRSLTLDPGAVYSVSLKNYFHGKWIRHCGWYPDRHVRLYHRRRTRFTDARVHEEIITTGLREIRLEQPVHHYSFASSADFLTKMQRYSDLFVEENRGRKTSSLTKAITRSFWAFLKHYFFQLGFLSGREGFIISVANSQGVFYKYVKLMEANQRGQNEECS